MRVLLTIQYLGTRFHGWQKQPGKVTIQQTLEDAIFKALGEECQTFASGRTDAGVHAWGQCVHFDTSTKIKAESLAYAINRFLPTDISILKSQEVSPEFNARFDVVKKCYEYSFYASNISLPLLDAQFARVRPDFDYTKATKAVKHFLGEHDFEGFCSAGKQTKTTVRTIYNIELQDLGDNKYKLVVCGNGFLYNMVRIIAGTIIEVGYGRIDPNKIPEIINSKNRSRAGKTAQACGLALKKVEYK